MVGTDDTPIQINESYFQGRRKYNRGRLQLGDKKKNESNASNSRGEDNREEKGPWVFGLYESISSVRFYVDQNRKAPALIPLILGNVAEESTIVSDEWMAYISLEEHGYNHETVNHSTNSVNLKQDSIQRPLSGHG